MRKGGGPGDRSDLRVGAWRVQPALNQISDGPTVRHLEPQVMNLLVFLASTGGRVVSKQDIVDAIWEGRFIADATLTRSMADLRRAFGDTGRQGKYVETIAKRGYRLVAPVSASEGDEDAAQPVDATSPVAPSIARESASLVVLLFPSAISGRRRTPTSARGSPRTSSMS